MSNIFDLIIVIAVLLFLAVFVRYKNPYTEEVINRVDVTECAFYVCLSYKNGKTEIIKKIFSNG